MNEQIQSLFKDLESTNAEMQMESALALAFLLERALWPGRNDSTHRLVLSDELLRLRLEGTTLENVLMKACDQLNVPTISIGAKMGLSYALGKSGRALCVKAVLALLERECDSLTDENACGLILSLVPSIMSANPQNVLRSAINEHHTPTVLQKLADRNSERLSEPLARLQSCISMLKG